MAAIPEEVELFDPVGSYGYSGWIFVVLSIFCSGMFTGALVHFLATKYWSRAQTYLDRLCEMAHCWLMLFLNWSAGWMLSHEAPSRTTCDVGVQTETHRHTRTQAPPHPPVSLKSWQERRSRGLQKAAQSAQPKAPPPFPHSFRAKVADVDLQAMVLYVSNHASVWHMSRSCPSVAFSYGSVPIVPCAHCVPFGDWVYTDENKIPLGTHDVPKGLYLRPRPNTRGAAGALGSGSSSSGVPAPQPHFLDGPYDIHGSDFEDELASDSDGGHRWIYSDTSHLDEPGNTSTSAETLRQRRGNHGSSSAGGFGGMERVRVYPVHTASYTEASSDPKANAGFPDVRESCELPVSD